MEVKKCRRISCHRIMPLDKLDHGYCPQHAHLLRKPYENAERRMPKAHYGTQWAGISSKYLQDHPTCVHCGARATHTDHIQPRRHGGTNGTNNLQALCHACHTRKTNAENLERVDIHGNIAKSTRSTLE